MRRRVEPIVFSVLAAILHLAVLALALGPEAPEAGGGGGGGGGGMPSVAAAPAEIAALVEAWETQPEPSAPPQRRLSSSMPDAGMRPVAPVPNAPQAARLSEALPLPTAPPAPLGTLPPPITESPPAEQRPERGEMAEPESTLPSVPDARAPSDRAPHPATSPAPERRPVPPHDALRRETVRAAPKPTPQLSEQRESAERADAPMPSEGAASSAGPSSATARAEAGSGGGASAGAGAAGAGGGAGGADAKSSLGAAVRAAIEREKSYPRRARMRGVEGLLALQVTISRDGRLLGAGIARSSGEAMLDDAALDAARSVGRYPSAPGDLPGAEFSFVIPIAFQLR